MVWIKCVLRALHFGVFKTWESLEHLLPVACACSQVTKTVSVGIWTGQMLVNVECSGRMNRGLFVKTFVRREMLGQ